MARVTARIYGLPAGFESCTARQSKGPESKGKPDESGPFPFTVGARGDMAGTGPLVTSGGTAGLDLLLGWRKRGEHRERGAQITRGSPRWSRGAAGVPLVRMRAASSRRSR